MSETDYFNRYLQIIPLHNQWKLDNVLKWNTREFTKIAASLSSWQLPNLRLALELDKGDFDVINSVTDPILKK